MKTVNRSTVDYLDHLGSDLTIVNAARVSFDKESEWYFDDGCSKMLQAKDFSLINYLARHNHWSPFAHTSIQLRVTAPIFVARQLVKHQVGGVWNEVSRRYVDDEPVFYFPGKWRKRAENVKQGSSDEEVDWTDFDNSEDTVWYDSAVEKCLLAYNSLLKADVAPEQARMILPQNMMTSWYWTGSLMFFYRVWKQRSDSHAQMETQEVAKQIADVCEELFPVSWKALVESK